MNIKKSIHMIYLDNLEGGEKNERKKKKVQA